jgi:hypothetical protein
MRHAPNRLAMTCVGERQVLDAGRENRVLLQSFLLPSPRISRLICCDGASMGTLSISSSLSARTAGQAAAVSCGSLSSSPCGLLTRVADGFAACCRVRHPVVAATLARGLTPRAHSVVTGAGQVAPTSQAAISATSSPPGNLAVSTIAARISAR